MTIPGVEHLLVLVGSSRDQARAEKFGLSTPTRIGPISGVGGVLLAARRYARLLDHRYWFAPPASRERLPDVQLAWSIPAAAMIRAAPGYRQLTRLAAVLRTTPPAPRGSPAYRRLKHALAHTQPFALGRQARDSVAHPASARRGGLFQRDNIRLFDPPIDPAPRRVPDDEQRALRRELGIADDAFSVVLLADPPSAGDAHRFAFALGLAFAARIRVSGIVPCGLEAPSRLSRAAGFLRDHNRRWGLSVSPRPIDQLLRAADLAIALTPDPRLDESPLNTLSCGTTSIALALSLGVPVIGPASETIAAVLGPDLASACIGRRSTVNDAGGRLIEILSSPPALEDLRQRALSRARDMAQLDAFRRDLLAIMEEMTGRPTIRPGLPIPPALRDPLDAPVINHT